MFYHYPVTIPNSTLEADATKTTMKLPAGEVHQVEVGFPWGCAGLAHVQIYRNEHQMWPTNPGESYAWNDYNVVMAESEDCAGDAEEWSIRCWNLDTRHPHTIVVRMGVLEKSRTMFGKIARALFGGPGPG